MEIKISCEMQSAIDELNQAQQMFDNAANQFRTNEAAYRIKAAQERIQAIRYEEGQKKED
jgi:hypothetical protein